MSTILCYFFHISEGGEGRLSSHEHRVETVPIVIREGATEGEGRQRGAEMLAARSAWMRIIKEKGGEGRELNHYLVNIFRLITLHPFGRDQPVQLQAYVVSDKSRASAVEPLPVCSYMRKG